MEILHSKIIGQGKPLVILHGFLGMSDNWKTLANQYAENGFEVHLIDQRNHGKSFQTDAFNYDFMVGDLLNYCKLHHLTNISLLGHSMGGKTAMFFATMYPEKIEKLIIADIAPKYYPQHHQIILAGLNALDFEVIKTRQEADEQLANYIKDFATRQFLLKNLYWKTKELLAFRFNLTSLTQHVEEIGKGLPETATFNGKTLFLSGDRSNYIQQEDESLIKKHFQNAFIENIDNSGHWLHAENPKMFFEKTIKFLKS